MKRGALSRSVVERFHKYSPVEKPPGFCWLWTGSLDAHGYGQLSDKPNKTVLKAHRIAYEIHHGSIDRSKLICHSCDNPCCINPEHLFMGAHVDNTRDMIRKGRGKSPPRLIGELHPASRLKSFDVKNIRSSRAAGVLVALQYGVSQSLVSAIRNNKLWKHL